MAEQVEWHAWFSKKQQESTGVVEYKTPQGLLVQVTQVTEEKEHGSGYTDMEYRGIVTTFVRRVVAPVINISGYKLEEFDARETCLRPGTSW